MFKGTLSQARSHAASTHLHANLSSRQTKPPIDDDYLSSPPSTENKNLASLRAHFSSRATSKHSASPPWPARPPPQAASMTSRYALPICTVCVRVLPCLRCLRRYKSWNLKKKKKTETVRRGPTTLAQAVDSSGNDVNLNDYAGKVSLVGWRCRAASGVAQHARFTHVHNTDTHTHTAGGERG